MGPIGESQDYIIVLMDLFTKRPFIEVVSKADTNSVLEFLDPVFFSEGTPITLLSNNGVQFNSLAAKTYFDRVGLKHKTTALYNPSGNGTVERFNRVLKGAIQGAISNGNDWKLAVKKAVWTKLQRVLAINQQG